MLNDKQLDGKLMALMNQKAIAPTTKGVICKVSLNALPAIYIQSV